MSEHSKGTELRFEPDENNIYALGHQGEWLAVELHANPERLDWQAAEAEMEVLGRKMAAAQELVEVVLRLLVGVGAQINGGVHAAYHTEADVQAARAALEKAGVKP